MTFALPVVGAGPSPARWLTPASIAVAVVALAAAWRPAPARMRALTAAGGAARAPGRLPGVMGRAMAVAAVVVATLAHPLLGALLAAAVLARRPLARRRAGKRTADGVEAALPEVVDLLALVVGAGLTVPLALRAVMDHAPAGLRAALERVVAEAAAGCRLADALDDLPRWAGESTRPLSAALAASERYGTPLGPTLARLAEDARRRRVRRAEEAARRVPVLMLFPLVLCTLPAFALLTVAPLLADALRSLHL